MNDHNTAVYHVVDFHVHPKGDESEFIENFREAGARAVILATDTYPEDLDRQEVIEHIRQTYAGSDISRMMGFDYLLGEIRKTQRSDTHVDNERALELAGRYPDVLIPFGSVDLCRSRSYVVNTLEWITKNDMRGIKLLPYSQFFDPAESENAETMMDFCSKHGLIVLSHTGCAAGVFESPYLNMYSRPSRWRKLAIKYPDVPIVLAHFGSYSQMMPGIWFEEAINLMKECRNVYSDTAAVWRLLWNEEMVSMIRDNDLFGQVLFGTDYPMPAMLPGGEKGVVHSILNNALLTESEKGAVLGDNAIKLLRL